MFVFISLVIGLAVGSQLYMTAILGTFCLLGVVLYLHATGFGSHGRFDGYLTVRVISAGIGLEKSSGLLDRFCRASKQVSTRQSGEDESAEYVFQIGPT